MTQILPPPSFGQFGFYRGDSIQDNMEFPLKHSGVDSCLECHEQVITKWSLSIHNNVSCESCHGAAAQHVETNSSLGLIIPLDQLCILCHSESISRPENFPQINSDDHWTNITLHNIPSQINSTCTSCHEPKSKTITGYMIPHLIEGLSDCTSCHGLEQIKPFLSNHILRPDESCNACHNQDVLFNVPEILHTLKDRSVCSSCHGIDAELQFPEDHIYRTDNLCLSCHSTEIDVIVPHEIPLIPHSLEGRTVCTSCHGPQAIEYPESHVGRSNDICLSCHNADIAVSIPQIQHPLNGYTDCLTCHVSKIGLQYPPDHKGRPENGCLNCHNTDREIHIPKLLHSIVGRLNCVNCHGSDSAITFSDTHLERSDDICLVCHKTDIVVEIPQTIPLIPHSLEDRSVCSSCHGLDVDIHYPENHSERPDDLCLICHELKK